MRYRLVMTTNAPGREELLAETLRSFRANVTPDPVEVLIQADGIAASDQTGRVISTMGMAPAEWWPLTVYSATVEPAGWCPTVARAWELATFSGVDWVFWLEDDFTFDRPVDLGELAAVMEAEPQVAQMALVRQAVGSEPPGGWVVQHRPSFADRETAGHKWLEHEHWWTLNPHLLRRSVCGVVDWPAVSPPGVIGGCEGAFLGIVQAAIPGATLGVWGRGEQWVTHNGRRTGFGF